MKIETMDQFLELVEPQLKELPDPTTLKRAWNEVCRLQLLADRFAEDVLASDLTVDLNGYKKEVSRILAATRGNLGDVAVFVAIQKELPPSDSAHEGIAIQIEVVKIWASEFSVFLGSGRELLRTMGTILIPVFKER